MSAPFQYYYLGKVKVVPFPASKTIRVTGANIEELISPHIQNKNGIWLIRSHAWHSDRKGIIRKWLELYYHRIGTRMFRGIELYLYQ